MKAHVAGLVMLTIVPVVSAFGQGSVPDTTPPAVQTDSARLAVAMDSAAQVARSTTRYAAVLSRFGIPVNTDSTIVLTEAQLRQITAALPGGSARSVQHLDSTRAVAVRAAAVQLYGFGQGAMSMRSHAKLYDVANKFALSASPFVSPTFDATYSTSRNWLSAGLAGAAGFVISYLGRSSAKDAATFAGIGVALVPIWQTAWPSVKSKLGKILPEDPSDGRVSTITNRMKEINELLAFNQAAYREAVRIRSLMQALARQDSLLGQQMHDLYERRGKPILLNGQSSTTVANGGALLVDSALVFTERFYLLRDHFEAAIAAQGAAIEALRLDPLYLAGTDLNRPLAERKIASETKESLDSVAAAHAEFVGQWNTLSKTYFQPTREQARLIESYYTLSDIRRLLAGS